MRLLTTVAAAGLLAGCVSAHTQAEAVMQRAAFDLECETGTLHVTELGSNVFGAEGCGRRASYVVVCPGFLKASCTPILDSERSGPARAAGSGPSSAGAGPDAAPTGAAFTPAFWSAWCSNIPSVSPMRAILAHER